MELRYPASGDLSFRHEERGAQGAHSAQILMTGVSDRSLYFIPKKITTSKFVYQKKSPVFLAYPKNPLVLLSQPKKIPLLFFRDPKKKIPASFIDPKNSLWPKFQTQKTTRTLPSLKYVSRTLGTWRYERSFPIFARRYSCVCLYVHSKPACSQHPHFFKKKRLIFGLWLNAFKHFEGFSLNCS